MKTRLLLFLLFSLSFGNAQINVNEGFESGTLPSGWFLLGNGGSVSSTTPISGTQSVFFSAVAGTKDLLTADYTSTGNAINISFLSKESGAAFVTYEVLYKINNTSAVSLGFQTRASSTVPQNNTYTISAGTIPAGSLVDVTIRVFVMSGSASMFVDDVVITQAALPIAPPSITDVSVSSITSSSANIFYNINANGSITTSLIRYGIDAGTLNFQVAGHPSTGGIGSGIHPITGLLPNTQYFYSIEATNSEGTTFSSGSFHTLLGPQLLANYTFDNTLNDVNGTNAFASQPGMTYGTDRLNIANKALFINGTGTTVSLTNLPVGNSSRTFSFWIKPTQFNGANRIFSYGSPSETAAYGASFDATSVYNFIWEDDVIYLQSTSLNVWKHIVCTFEQSTNTARLYIDGVLRASNVFSLSTANNGILYLGSLFGETGSRYIGFLDDLQIYNYALSNAEVTNLYNNNTLSSSSFSQNNLEVKLYPNPVRDILNIEIENDIQSIEIYNIQGQKVLSSNQKQLNVSDLATGMYIVRIQDIDNNIATKKIVIK
jgi:hypothetical protein